MRRRDIAAYEGGKERGGMMMPFMLPDALTDEDCNEHVVMLDSLEHIDFVVQLARIDLIEDCNVAPDTSSGFRDEGLELRELRALISLNTATSRQTHVETILGNPQS